MLVTSSLRLAAVVFALAIGATVAQAEEQKLELMFVQTSAAMSADVDEQTLRLVQVTPQTLYFADRPERVAGHVKMADYLSEWTEGEDNFGEDPPNATLSVYEPDAAKNTLVVVEIFDPVVDGDDLIYRYELIEGEMPASGDQAALFIDWIGPGGGVGRGFHGVGVGARGPGVTGWRGVARQSCASGAGAC